MTTASFTEIIDTAEIEAIQQRVREIRAQLQDRPAMKYALESLPELIGEQDFKDLCVALGIDYLEDATGRDVADAVRGAVIRRERKLASGEMSPAVKAMLDADHKAAAEYTARAACMIKEVDDHPSVESEVVR